MWDSYTPLTKEVQQQRINEIVYIIKKEGKIVGVSTVYLKKPPKRVKKFYFFRTFIQLKETISLNK